MYGIDVARFIGNYYCFRRREGGRTDLSYLANNHLVTNYQNSMIMTGLIILVSLIDNDFIELSI